MELFEILHGEDECELVCTIVSSHICLNDHYFVTWDFKEKFELWHEDCKSGYELIKSSSCNRIKEAYSDTELSFAKNIGDEIFQEWLDSLGD